MPRRQSRRERDALTYGVEAVFIREELVYFIGKGARLSSREFHILKLAYESSAFLTMDAITAIDQLTKTNGLRPIHYRDA